MSDHAELIRRAREHAETLVRTGCGTQAGLYRELADALEGVVRERDSIHAYAAFLQQSMTLKPDWGAWTAAEAVEWVRKVASGTHHRLAWRKNEQASIAECEAAVRDACRSATEGGAE